MADSYPISWDLPGLQVPDYLSMDPQSQIDSAGVGWLNNISDVINTGLDGYFGLEQSKWNAIGSGNWGPLADQSPVQPVQNAPGDNLAQRYAALAGGTSPLIWIAGGLLAVGAFSLLSKKGK